MPRFTEIFESHSLDGRPEAARLNAMAEAVGWTVLQPGQSIGLDQVGHAIVISGVTWSKPDLEVLDELAARDTAGTRVWFFNPDYVFQSQA